jgi:hypothetical protein
MHENSDIVDAACIAARLPMTRRTSTSSSSSLNYGGAKVPFSGEDLPRGEELKTFSCRC